MGSSSVALGDHSPSYLAWPTLTGLKPGPASPCPLPFSCCCCCCFAIYLKTCLTSLCASWQRGLLKYTRGVNFYTSLRCAACSALYAWPPLHSLRHPGPQACPHRVQAANFTYPAAVATNFLCDATTTVLIEASAPIGTCPGTSTARLPPQQPGFSYLVVCLLLVLSFRKAFGPARAVNQTIPGSVSSHPPQTIATP